VHSTIFSISASSRGTTRSAPITPNIGRHHNRAHYDHAPMRLRRLVLAVIALAVLALGGGFAFFALRGADAPPPPRLQAPEGTEAGDIAPGDYTIAQPTFVGYRVREKFVTFGVADAVGRTANVTGAATIDGDRVTGASLRTDMTTLRSDESRRDDALRGRAIETDRYPGSRFELTEPFPISRRAAAANGRLTLHGRTQPIVATVQGQRTAPDTVQLAGSADIDFKAFGIRPPSVAGFVTVEDHGTLEFELRLKAR
jgi:polyisoprenoid-binding protein YceI